MYNLQSLASEKLVLISMKCVDLVNRSMITQIALCLSNVISNPITKSMVILSHFYSSIFNDWSKPKGLWCSIFIYWKIIHFAIKEATSFFIPFHQYWRFISWYIGAPRNVNWSTIIQIALCLWNVIGNPITKSMVILSHFYSGIFNGWSNLDGLWCSAFTYWHIIHFATKKATSFFIPFHQYWRFISWYIGAPMVNDQLRPCHQCLSEIGVISNGNATLRVQKSLVVRAPNISLFTIL